MLTLDSGYTEEGFASYKTTGFDLKSETENYGSGTQLKNSWQLLP